jgi:hypothetical protein
VDEIKVCKEKNRIDFIRIVDKNGCEVFKGIREGKQDCNQKPIVFEVNAQEKYEDYLKLNPGAQDKDLIESLIRNLK